MAHTTLAWIVCGAALTACSSGLEGNVYRGDGFAFRVTPPPNRWKRLEASDAALAYRDDAHQASIMLNARCGLDGDDIPLKALTQHLFLQFTEREVRQQEVVPFDGREAMHTVMSAKLDGVQMTFDVWIMKKDGCVYDLLYLAPDAVFEKGRPTFRAMVQDFATVEVGNDG